MGVCVLCCRVTLGHVGRSVAPTTPPPSCWVGLASRTLWSSCTVSRKGCYRHFGCPSLASWKQRVIFCPLGSGCRWVQAGAGGGAGGAPSARPQATRRRPRPRTAPAPFRAALPPPPPASQTFCVVCPIIAPVAVIYFAHNYVVW